MVTMTVRSLFKEDAYTVNYWLYISRSKSSLHFALVFCGPRQGPTSSAYLVNTKDQSLYEICASI